MNFRLWLSLLCLTLVTAAPRAENEGTGGIDKVGPIQKVGPLDKVGPIAPIQSNPQQPNSPVPTNNSPAPSQPGGISIQGTGEDFVDFSTRSPAGKEKVLPQNKENDSTDALEEMAFGGHKKSSGGGDSSSSDDSTNAVVRNLFNSTPNLMELNQAPKLESDAPPGMKKVEMPEVPNKDPRKNFPAQAGGNSAGC